MPTWEWLTEFFFGIGSMDNKEEVPAPVLIFLAGLSSSEFSVLSVTGRDGREMVNFFGARFVNEGLEVLDIKDSLGSDSSESLA